MADDGRIIPQLSIEAFKLVLELLERDPPEISAAVLADAFPELGHRLIDCGALRPVANATVVTCRACNADHAAEVEFDAAMCGYRHSCPEAGWVPVSADDLKRYRADPSWLLSLLAHTLGIPKRSRRVPLIEDVLWDLGEVWLGKRKATVLFGRRLSQSDNLDRACDALANRIGRPSGVLLSTTDRLSRHVRLPGCHRFLPIRDCVAVGASGLEIDQGIIKGVTSGAVRREGFSTGYRTALVDGIEYKFSKKQAAIIEALDNAGGPIHKDELLAAADTDQTELIQVFRSKGKTHPAWGALILHDNQGNYFLRR